MPAFDRPSHLVEDWQLLDGTPVRIRPIRADDLAMHTAFVAGLSNETGYHRLLSPRKPQPDELRRMTDIDYRHELALIGTTRWMARSSSWAWCAMCAAPSGGPNWTSVR